MNLVNRQPGPGGYAPRNVEIGKRLCQGLPTFAWLPASARGTAQFVGIESLGYDLKSFVQSPGWRPANYYGRAKGSHMSCRLHAFIMRPEL
ncbi:MAG: hypothetical protein ACYCZN_01315 [Candidatus Dormibacteria bacterium]